MQPVQQAPRHAVESGLSTGAQASRTPWTERQVTLSIAKSDRSAECDLESQDGRLAPCDCLLDGSVAYCLNRAEKQGAGEVACPNRLHDLDNIHGAAVAQRLLDI